MRITFVTAAALLLLGFSWALQSNAARPSTRPAILIEFSPQANDAPQRVVVAGSRAGVAHPREPAFRYAVLAPQQRLGPQRYARARGATTQPSPSLFWFTNKSTMMRAEINIFKEDAGGGGATTIRRVELSDALACGMQRLDLKRLGVQLEPGGVYRWTVTYFDDIGAGPVSEALLVCLPADDPRTASLAKLNGLEGVTACATSGAWYDLLETLNDMIDADPMNASLREARLRCLESRNVNLGVSAWISASGSAR